MLSPMTEGYVPAASLEADPAMLSEMTKADSSMTSDMVRADMDPQRVHEGLADASEHQDARLPRDDA